MARLYILFVEASLFEQRQSRLRVTQLADKQEVHLTHSVAHMLRTEQTLVRLQARLYSFYLAAHIAEQILQQLLRVELKIKVNKKKTKKLL